MDEILGKFDVIIIIVLALLVAFIIGFNIIQIIDNKLNSVIINVPPQHCSLPTILVNFDKDNKPIKLNNEQLNVLKKEHIEDFENINSQSNFANLDQTINSCDSESNDNFGNINNDYTGNEINEHFGSLPLEYSNRDSEHIDIYSQQNTSNLANEIVNSANNVNKSQNKNYNTIDNYPYLINPNSSSKDDKNTKNTGYYQSRVKLISDTSSPLLKLEEKNIQKINQVFNSCIKNEPIQQIDDKFNGYNKYPNLQTGSFAKFTSIGKSLLTPYVSYPVPS
jgi:hypothetical protein